MQSFCRTRHARDATRRQRAHHSRSRRANESIFVALERASADAARLVARLARDRALDRSRSSCRPTAARWVVLGAAQTPENSGETGFASVSTQLAQPVFARGRAPPARPARPSRFHARPSSCGARECESDRFRTMPRADQRRESRAPRPARAHARRALERAGQPPGN